MTGTKRSHGAKGLWPLGPEAERGFAMLTVVLLIMICAGASILMLGSVLAQVKPTIFAEKNTRTVAAAEAGIDATLSQLRTATIADAVTGALFGNPHGLPCTIVGPVGAAGSSLTYTATITYFDLDPSGRSAAWRATAGNFIPCVPGSGLNRVPGFALITSSGADAALPGYDASVGDRTLETVYTFQVDNSTIPGGVIYSYGDAYCLQADGVTVGSTVSYVAAAVCDDDDQTRLWAWGKDYSIHLAVTDLLPATPLCITGRGGIQVTLQVCNISASNQKFSWFGGAKWMGQKSDMSDYSNECLGAGSATPAVLTGRKLKITTDCPSTSSYASFDPDARVGAGAAGFDTIQVVNFLEFGRCFDVTDETWNKAFMIIYPCKQDPSGGSKLAWNHKWTYTEPLNKLGNTATTISVTNGTKYCLRTPSAAASPAYPTLVACSAGNLDQRWIRTAEGDSYSNSWTFVDRYGRCISLGDKYSVYWSKMTVAACNGGPEQKWNAPTNSQTASLDNFNEIQH